jgi:arylsulfatase A-like enzyme
MKSSFRSFAFCILRQIAGLSLFAAALPVLAAPLAGSRPNIILILTDDQGYGDFHCTGNPIIQTPNMDRIHDEGVRFTDFHVSPTCAPTRASIMSGKHEFKNGVTHTINERERMSLKTVTIAQMLKAAGYQTSIFGKWHLGDEPDHWPSKRGFDEMFIHGAGGIGQTYPGSCGDAPGNKYFDPVILHNGTFEKTAGYCTDVFFGQALKWMESVKAKQPFFIYLAPNAPHAPLVCPTNYAAKYDGKVAPMVAKFFGMIENIDDNVGKLMARLKALGLDDQTLVILMNDNGGTVGVPLYNAGMRDGKNTPYNGGTRAAAFWRWPGRLQPMDVDRLTCHRDLYPTFAELAGAKIPANVDLDGMSLVPLLQAPNASWPDRYIFTHIGRWAAGQGEHAKYNGCSVRNSHYNLVCNSKTDERNWELYDLRADPGEKINLAAQHPDIANTMEAAYDQWWNSVLPCLENENAKGPAANSFAELYWKQYGGPGPNNVPVGGGKSQQ